MFRGVRIDDNVRPGALLEVAARAADPGDFLLDGVGIGADTIVGAGSVVTDDLPARRVAARVPARVVRER